MKRTFQKAMGLAALLADPVTRAQMMNATTNLQGSTKPIPFRDIAQEYDAGDRQISKQNTFAVASTSGVGPLDYGIIPRRIPHLFNPGLRMLAGYRQPGHPLWMTGNTQGDAAFGMWLPPPKWSNPTRGTRAISQQSRHSFQQMDRISIPSVMVPTVSH